jgi:antitoxin component YwqK of YwqJK toxin-antitoxin module
MRSSLPVFVMLSIAALISCSKDNATSDKDDHIQKYYYPDGSLYMEIEVKNDSIPHGLSKEYFKGGQIFQEIHYVDGKRDGAFTRYYENGTLSMECTYAGGKRHGIEKKYRKDGSVAYEAPYYFDQPMIGLKEYYTDGTLVRNYPEIVVNESTTMNGSTLLISLSNPAKVEFYVCELVDDKYLSADCPAVEMDEKGMGKIEYHRDPLENGLQSEFTRDITIVAKVKTDLGNSYITRKTYSTGSSSF